MRHYTTLLMLFFIVFSIGNTLGQDTDNVITFKLGAFEVSTLSEGQHKGSASILIDAAPEILSKYAPDGTFPGASNAFLIRTPNKKILIDTGFGRKLFDNLASLNVTAGDIDIILITHMHGDHIGGLLNEDKALFPTAEIYIAQAEHDYWMSDDAMKRVPENRRSGFIHARAVIKAYKGRLHLFTPGELTGGKTPLLQGFQSIAAPGHTPGHTAYLIESESEQMLIWGDLTHAMQVQMPHPEIAVTYDIDPKQAITSRMKMLDYLTKNKIPGGGMHVPFPAIGDLKKGKNKEAFVFTPLCLCLGI